MKPRYLINPLLALTLLPFQLAADTITVPLEEKALRVQIEFGRLDEVRQTPVIIEGRNLLVLDIQGEQLEDDDSIGFVSEISAGGGDLDSLILTVAPVGETAGREPQSIWAYLLEHTESGAAERLAKDSSLIAWAPVVTVKTSLDGQRGFSFALSQLLTEKAMWLPDHGVFLTLADEPVDYAAHLSSLSGRRVMDQVAEAPEASWETFAARWEDMGSVDWNPDWETEWLGLRGHLVCVSPSHGSLYKFAIGRWGSVRPDFASPHKYRLDFLWPEDARWEKQRLDDGLPILQTSIAAGAGRFELEQFAVSMPFRKEQGAPGVLMTKIVLPGDGAALQFRLQAEQKDKTFSLKRVGEEMTVVDSDGRIWLVLQTTDGVRITGASLESAEDKGIALEAAGKGTLVIKLPSPTISQEQVGDLAGISYADARSGVVDHWQGLLQAGALFNVPDEQVNQLFRANLWHALRLPRFRQTENGAPLVDLPYSNTAYGQLNVEWPVNQAVYVDYMIYALRGHNDFIEDELAAIYRQQQRANGRIGGFANWGVYTPSMLYTTAQYFLLSKDRQSFERLLDPSLRALNWCLRQVEESQLDDDVPGLVRGPLNDLTERDGAWAFTQAYYYAGIRHFGKALEKLDHPLAKKCAEVSTKLRADIEMAFRKAAVRSPVVQLADGTWINYVPCDALEDRRLMDVWYPTDIDTGALHLSRLEAIDPLGELTEWLIHDHEDNLFLNQWGMANEPVYNQQATAYLLRDEPEAVIRAFYSMMACAFSHGQLEPVEHRWAWGQYFGPPSTDGAWFELYRRMLILEQEDTLSIAQATPRDWLTDGKSITVERAPTWFGDLSLNMQSQAATGRIVAEVNLGGNDRPQILRVRFRHPEKATIKAVTINGAEADSFDPDSEWVIVKDPRESRYLIEVQY